MLLVGIDKPVVVGSRITPSFDEIFTCTIPVKPEIVKGVPLETKL